MWYRSKAHLRIAQFFGRGKYFLDAGSGPISEPEYIVYSSGYKLRVCVDISETALKEARSKIQDKGLYVVADVTQLPFRDGVFDAAISAHVLYHVPSDEQGTALMELYRTLRDPGVCIVVYGQFTGLSAHLEPLTRLVGRILALGQRIVGAQKHKREHRVGDSGPAESDETPPLYAYAHDRQWFQETIPREWNVDIRCWSIIDQSFTKRFVPDNLFGRYILGTIYWLETLFPHSLAWIGYQTIVIRKNNPDAKLSGIAVRT
jgi:SAM-dependent methyltransferase